ncbi:MAG: Gfo/Idh/MocA family protein [Acidimicrobiia bacterium]
MPDRLEAALVGLGWWGRQIAKTLDRSERIHVGRVVDPDRERAGPFADEHGLHLDADLARALADPQVAAVIIATPHLLHEEQVVAAAEAGKHVFCEKPLALQAAAARRMLEACRTRGLVLGVGHERRFEPAMEEAGRMIESGELGRLLHIECNWSHNYFAGSSASSWRQDPAQAPAGMLTALGVHITDLFQSMAGPVGEVRAIKTHRSAEFPTDDVLSVQLRFASGATGAMSHLATTPFYARLSVFGDRGWLEIRETSNVDTPEDSLLTWRGVDEEIHTRRYAPTNQVGANLDHWAAAALGAEDYRFTDDQLIHNIEILEAIVRSSESGVTMKVG